MVCGSDLRRTTAAGGDRAAAVPQKSDPHVHGDGLLTECGAGGRAALPPGSCDRGQVLGSCWRLQTVADVGCLPMDAGLAALLGAAVGTLGTGGAAVVTGLLGRSQARMQLQAEHARLLREPRRSAYVAFALCYQEVNALHMKAVKLASAAVDSVDPDRIRLLDDADDAYAQAGERLHGDLQRLQSGVTVEGPPVVTAAAFEAEDALLASRAELYGWLRHLKRGTAAAEHQRSAEDALLAVHPSLTCFLNQVSAVLADDGLPS